MIEIELEMDSDVPVAEAVRNAVSHSIRDRCKLTHFKGMTDLDL